MQAAAPGTKFSRIELKTTLNWEFAIWKVGDLEGPLSSVAPVVGVVAPEIGPLRRSPGLAPGATRGQISRFKQQAVACQRSGVFHLLSNARHDR